MNCSTSLIEVSTHHNACVKFCTLAVYKLYSSFNVVENTWVVMWQYIIGCMCKITLHSQCIEIKLVFVFLLNDWF